MKVCTYALHLHASLSALWEGSGGGGGRYEMLHVVHSGATRMPCSMMNNKSRHARFKKTENAG